MTRDEEIELLQKMAYYEGTEYGEAMQTILDIKRYDYCFNREFNMAVDREIKRLAEEIKNDYKFEEVTTTQEVTSTMTVVTYIPDLA